MMNGRQDAACAPGIPDHLPFFASGRKSTMRLYSVAAAIGCSVRIRAFSVGSAPARRLVVLRIADVLAPGGALALLACFRQRQMRE